MIPLLDIIMDRPPVQHFNYKMEEIKGKEGQKQAKKKAEAEKKQAKKKAEAEKKEAKKAEKKAVKEAKKAEKKAAKEAKASAANDSQQTITYSEVVPQTATSASTQDFPTLGVVSIVMLLAACMVFAMKLRTYNK